MLPQHLLQLTLWDTLLGMRGGQRPALHALCTVSTQTLFMPVPSEEAEAVAVGKAGCNEQTAELLQAWLLS